MERAGGAHPALLPTHLSTTRCQDPHLPPTLSLRLPGQIRNQATQPPRGCPHPQSPSHNQEDERHPSATPSSARAGGAAPAPSTPRVPTSPLLPQAGNTPSAPQSLPTSAPPPPRGARPPQAGRSACTLTSWSCDTHAGGSQHGCHLLPRAMPCRRQRRADTNSRRGAGGATQRRWVLHPQPPGAAGGPATLRQKPRPRARRPGGPCGAIRELFIISSCGPG